MKIICVCIIVSALAFVSNGQSLRGVQEEEHTEPKLVAELDLGQGATLKYYRAKEYITIWGYSESDDGALLVDDANAKSNEMGIAKAYEVLSGKKAPAALVAENARSEDATALTNDGGHHERRLSERCTGWWMNRTGNRYFEVYADLVTASLQTYRGCVGIALDIWDGWKYRTDASNSACAGKRVTVQMGTINGLPTNMRARTYGAEGDGYHWAACWRNPLDV